jgi:hypothetical protein
MLPWPHRLFVLTVWLELLCGLLTGQIVAHHHGALHSQVTIERSEPAPHIEHNARERISESTQEVTPMPDEPPVLPPGNTSLALRTLLDDTRLLILSVASPRGPPARIFSLIQLTALHSRGPPSLPLA